MSKKILYFVTEDWFFCSHFLDRALAARQAGYEVAVVTRVGQHGDAISAAGIRVIPLNLERRSVNPLREISVLRELIRIYRSERPHLVHHVALKPIVYGTMAAIVTRVPAVVNAPVGMGYVFSSDQAKARFARPFVLLIYRLLMSARQGVVIVENPDDGTFFKEKGIARQDQLRLIRGAGVDLTRFVPSGEPSGVPVVVLPARMLWDKGVGQFVEAAGRLRSAGVSARFVLVGDADPGNPASISEDQLRGWVARGDVEWWGYRADMPEVLGMAHIVCLPSYREGLPKALIEAAACARPIVTTDVPGCREVVRDGENGFVVPPRDAEALARSLRLLIEDRQLRSRMGARGRELATAEFSVEKVIHETLGVYRELLA